MADSAQNAPHDYLSDRLLEIAVPLEMLRRSEAFFGHVLHSGDDFQTVCLR